jgi:hypothetical protein
VAYRSHQGVGGTQVNTHSNTPFVRIGRLAGLGDL